MGDYQQVCMLVAENAENDSIEPDGDDGDGGDARSTKRGCWKISFVLNKKGARLRFQPRFMTLLMRLLA